MGGYIPPFSNVLALNPQLAAGSVPAPNFNFPGGGYCPPCGINRYQNLPENVGKVTNTGCAPSNCSSGYNPNPLTQPQWPVFRQQPSTWTPPPVLPNIGRPIWQQPQFPTTGTVPGGKCPTTYQTPHPVN